ncbi:uncharacterized protein LOC124438981 isoform X2 [Xenia sp. Carnegie-2017]|uniref:uncharacterized protein LOC124438981 isoform X2 n=1 Tax=Xenia sp. Carnegie-2017 TaxID=2897299 RepID=UPI001F042800|nr:uncharacterized protein LOC124438981 isoform X2 [Xenia sp. Carnegie-2017]
MGSLLNKLRIYVEKMNQSPRNETRYSKNNGVRQDGRRGKEKDSLTIVKNGSGEQLQKDDVKTANTSRYMKRRPRLTVDEMNEAKEKIGKLEGELKIHKTVMVEHKTKMMMLEELIKRQCLVIKQNDDLYSYEELATGKLNTQTLWERIETQLGTMIDKKTNDDPCNEVSLVKIKHQFNQQHLQLQEHGQCIKRHEEQFEDQLARIEMMREMLDENSMFSKRCLSLSEIVNQLSLS